MKRCNRWLAERDPACGWFVPNADSRGGAQWASGVEAARRRDELASDLLPPIVRSFPLRNREIQVP